VGSLGGSALSGLRDFVKCFCFATLMGCAETAFGGFFNNRLPLGFFSGCLFVRLPRGD